jgi:hypothetical protein
LAPPQVRGPFRSAGGLFRAGIILVAGEKVALGWHVHLHTVTAQVCETTLAIELPEGSWAQGWLILCLPEVESGNPRPGPPFRANIC